MASIKYDERSLILDGKRIWLVSGSVDYFRVPAELWSDRLLKAKRAGLNCISTFVPWNFHEPREGQWELSGDHDIVQFVRLAGEMGLYVILRPGPYIGANWDFGGLPSWLTAKSGMSYRTSGAAFTHYFDKFFRQILPPLSECQVTRGGSIVLIQCENNYVLSAMPDRLGYLGFINQLFRRAGFDVPIISSNGFCDPPAPDSVECVSGWDDIVKQLKRMRLRQPNGFLLVTDFETGRGDCWGSKHTRQDDREVARRAMEILGCGAQFNYSVWHGGTNFGFWAGRLETGADKFQTTSFDNDGAVAEGGGLTPRYYLTKLVNMLACHMGQYIAGCAMEEPGVDIHNSTSVLNMYGPDGRWAVVTNNGRDDIQSVDVSLPEGKTLTVPLEPLGAAAIPVDLRLSPNHILDYSNLMPLGLFGERILIFHGPPGVEGQISINGKELRAMISEDDRVEPIEHESMLVVLINSDLAMRTWLTEEGLALGPKFVGNTLEDVVCLPAKKQFALLSLEGKLTHRKARSTETRKPAAPKLGQWKRLRVCDEPIGKDIEWTRLDGPTELDRLDIPTGYAWYQIRVHSERARKRNLMLPNCADRATLFLNGQRIGVWGVGVDAVKKPLPASFKRGDNILTLLVDNLGRVQDGSRLGEPKGLFGHIWDAKPLKTRQFKISPLDTFPKRVIPRQLVHLVPVLKELPGFTAGIDISLTRVSPIHLCFEGLPLHAAVLCNDRVVGFFPNYGTNYADVTLSAELKTGKNAIKLLLWGELDVKALKAVKLFSLQENLTQDAEWAYRRWELPLGKGPVVGKNQPAWYVSKFRYTPQHCPLFLHILGARKGQVFLNGKNAGRFWNIAPQQHYYLPECWLEEENELLIFEESGIIPSGSRLGFRPLGPYRD